MRELRYFRPHEFACRCNCGAGFNEMDPTLLAMLDELRHRVGQPLYINSAFRCRSWNAKVGGVESSSHAKGMAVDIACTDGFQRFSLVKEAMAIGFRRIGVAETFIHLDIDPDKPQEVLFLY